MNDTPDRMHGAGIHLMLTSLGAALVDATGVQSVRAEDPTGCFGLLPGHADFLTVLRVGVVSWRESGGNWRHCAVRRGVLTLRRGRELSIATREAVLSDDLDKLEGEVRREFADRQQGEDAARRQERQLAVRAMRELLRPLRATTTGTFP